MVGLKTGSWVVVADSERALFLENHGDTAQCRLAVRRLLAQDNPPTRAQGTDRPGRYPPAAPGHGSAVEPTDWHQLEKARFAEDLAATLHRLSRAGRFSRLVLVAAPDTLGRLRPALDRAVAQQVVAEIPKNLTALPVPEIAAHVQRAVSA